jgi:phosphatidylinositol-bisphosphatase
MNSLDDQLNRRKPAWTDRILHVNSKAASVEQLSYQGHPGITMSDHRPVSADFVVSVREANSSFAPA